MQNVRASGKGADTDRPFIWTRTHALAGERLEFAIRSRSPVILMLGADGVGKTTLIDKVLDEKMEDLSIAFVTDPSQLDKDLRQTVREAVVEMRRMAPDDGGQAPVFIVDDAHRLLQTTLAELIDLARPEDGEEPILKLVLVAEPEFETVFRRLIPETAGPSFELAALPVDEARDFIGEVVKGMSVEPDFITDDEIDSLIDRWGGKPAHLIRSLEWRRDRNYKRPEISRIATAIEKKRRSTPKAEGEGGAAVFRTERGGVDLYDDVEEGKAGDPLDGADAIPETLAHHRPKRRMLWLFVYSVILLAVGAALYKGYEYLGGAPAFFGGDEDMSPPELADTAALPAAPVELYRHAITTAGEGPERSLLAMALAALQGHEKAAYFVGQMFETGEGAAPNPALAAAWYRSVAEELPRAAERADELAVTVDQPAFTTGTAPKLFHVEILESGDLFLMWNDEKAVIPQSYEIEFAGNDGLIVETIATDVPASLNRPHPRSRRFRVLAMSGGEAVRSTRWMPLPF